VVLHHLDGFRRTVLAGLLHPAADPGVRRVSRERRPDDQPKLITGANAAFPAT
jgi:hypothetical protein